MVNNPATQKFMMKGTMWFLYFFLISRISSAQYHPVENESAVQFTIKNFGFNVGGSFSGFEGEIRFNPDSLSAARFQVSVNAASINTDNNMRDSHLKEEDYLDVKSYPRIRFISESVRPLKRGNYLMVGKLTIKNKTKEISFPFSATPSRKGYLFTCSFKISRKDFDVGGSSTISDNISLNLKVLAK
jgi:polyisoprenoid-binding protein YceI